MPAPHFGQDTLAPQTMCPASVLAGGDGPSVESGSRWTLDGPVEAYSGRCVMLGR